MVSDSVVPQGCQIVPDTFADAAAAVVVLVAVVVLPAVDVLDVIVAGAAVPF
jgi:hypothetical protein